MSKHEADIYCPHCHESVVVFSLQDYLDYVKGMWDKKQCPSCEGLVWPNEEVPLLIVQELIETVEKLEKNLHSSVDSITRSLQARGLV